MASRSKFACLNCGEDTGKMGEHYMLNNDVWAQIHHSPTGMYCIRCAENRLGRTLRAEDFNDSYINNPKFGNKSLRLQNRLNRK